MKPTPTECKVSHFTKGGDTVKTIYHTTPLDEFSIEQIKWLEEHDSGIEGGTPYVVEPRSFKEDNLTISIVEFINSLG